MQGSHAHQMTFECFVQRYVRPNSFKRLVKSRVESLTIGNGRGHISLVSKGCGGCWCLCCLLGGDWFCRWLAKCSRCLMLWLCQGAVDLICWVLVHAEFKVLDPRDESVFLEPHEHLVVPGSSVLVFKLFALFFELIKLFLLLWLISRQFLLFLLDASVIDLLEISLFAQLIVCRPCLFSYNASLIQFFLQTSELIRQFSIASVNLWDLWQVLRQAISGFKFDPFLLERL